MIKIKLMLFVFVIVSLSVLVLVNLIIFEYVEGSFNNKVVELYNILGVELLFDGYIIFLYLNGNGDFSVFNNILDLIGIFVVNVIYVIVNLSFVDELKVKGNIELIIIYFNGDDVLVFIKDGVIVDSFG